MRQEKSIGQFVLEFCGFAAFVLGLAALVLLAGVAAGLS